MRRVGRLNNGECLREEGATAPLTGAPAGLGQRPGAGQRSAVPPGAAARSPAAPTVSRRC